MGRGIVQPELSQISRELRAANEQLKNFRAANRREREGCLMAALVAFTHEPQRSQEIAWYLTHRFAPLFGNSVKDVLRELEQRWLALPMSTTLKWLDWNADMGLSPRFVRKAQRMLDDLRVVQWIETQNRDRGLCPPPARILHYRKFTERTGLSNPCMSASMGMSTSHKENNRGWVLRFRSRWAMRMGRIPARQHLPVELKRRKV